MASVTKEQIPEVAAFMTDFWQTIKEFYKPESDDAWWDEVIDQCNRIAGKANHPLCTKMAVTFLRYLDDEQKAAAERAGR